MFSLYRDSEQQAVDTVIYMFIHMSDNNLICSLIKDYENSNINSILLNMTLK